VEATKQRDEITAQIASESARLESLRRSYRESEAEKSEIEKDNERLDRKISSIEEENSKLERGISKLEETIRAITDRVGSIRERINELTNSIGRMKQQIINRAEKPQEQSFGAMSLSARSAQAKAVSSVLNNSDYRQQNSRDLER
jgi:predicted nuclease with TOPRIM domain